jgi:hypothetical protein
MKKVYIFFVILICSIYFSPPLDSQPPNTWIQKANFSGVGRASSVAFSMGGKGYIGIGEDMYGNEYNDFWEYDTITNSWTQKANVGGGVRSRAIGFSIGSKGYIGIGAGGTGNFSWKNDLWEYDPTTNTWTQKANFEGTVRLDAVGFSIGSYGYIGTGQGEHGSYNKEFWQYDPSSDTWTQKADFGGTGRRAAFGFGIGNKGYIGTGVDTNNFKNDFWQYDPSSDTWSQKADFGGSARESTTGFNIGNKGYIGTGDNVSYLNDFWEYDPSADTWTQKANFGGTSRSLAVGFSIANKGFIGTGVDEFGNYRNDFWEYSPTCSAPNPPTNTTPPINQHICVGNSTTLTVSGTGTLGWYTAVTGGIWLGGGNSFTTPALMTNTTYYVQDSTCGPSPTRTAIPVTVYPVPSPTIIGQTSMCINSGYYNYSTEPGMQNYSWTVSSGGSINYGSGTNQIQVSWIAAGSQTVSVIYSNGSCSPSQPTVLNITVNPLPDQAGIITGIANVCDGSNDIAYSVAPVPNTDTYVWVLPPNATIVSGAGTNSITIDFAANATSGDIMVYGNNLCGDGSSSPPFGITVTALPSAAGNITGPDSVCQGSTGNIYTVPVITGATGYTWSLPAGATSGSGSGSNTISVDFSTSAVSGNINVYGTNACGSGDVSPNFFVFVDSTPPPPVVTNTGNTLYSSALIGNQWFYQGSLIQGATSQSYLATHDGYYWDVTKVNGCTSDTSNHKLIITTGVGIYPSDNIEIYPIPNEGKFNMMIATHLSETFSIEIYNSIGIKIFEKLNFEVNGSLAKNIDLRPISNGIYTIIVTNEQIRMIKKIIINN